MFQQAQNQRSIPGAVATIGVNERVTFLRKTYGHLAGAILAFVGLEYMLLDMEGPLFKAITLPFIQAVFPQGGGGGMGWLVVLGLFMAASWVAQKWANSDTSRGMQYAGLGLYVVAESLIFTPILLQAQLQFPGVIADAGVLTVFIFAGLTATVFLTKKDFSFMRGALTTAMFGAMGMIVASILFGFTLGTLFSGAMIVLMSGYILYTTSNVMLHYRNTQYVAASLALFAAIATLFWYVLRLLMALRD